MTKQYTIQKISQVITIVCVLALCYCFYKLNILENEFKVQKLRQAEVNNEFYKVKADVLRIKTWI